jgi:hypothetical protein
MEEKQCVSCLISMPITCFEKDAKNVRNVCKSCRYEQIKHRRNILRKQEKVIPSEKQCNTCKKTKTCDSFNKDRVRKDGLDIECKECCKSSRRKNNVISDATQLKTCTQCFKSISISNFKTNKRYKDGHYNVCNSCWRPREWTKEKQKLAEKKYCENNKEKLRNKWKKRGVKEDVRIKQRLTARIKSAFQYFGKRKSDKTYSYIGCSYSFLRKWFEFQFSDGITWENIGEWHIDHVKPCASFNFNNEDDINTCFNWKNLRPCWAKENIVKGDSIITEVIELHEKKVKEFLTTLPSHSGNRDDGVE